MTTLGPTMPCAKSLSTPESSLSTHVHLSDSSAMESRAKSFLGRGTKHSTKLDQHKTEGKIHVLVMVHVFYNGVSGMISRIFNKEETGTLH